MEETEDDWNPIPPTQERVVKRAITLGTLAYRGLVEPEIDNPEAVAYWKRFIDWYRSLSIEDELEEPEKAVLEAPLCTLTTRQAVNASWRVEAAAVLAWSLNLYKLPPHDYSSDISDVMEGLGLFTPKDEAAFATARPRTPEELEHYGSVALTVHWRLRQFGLKPEALNFIEFVEGAQWGPLTLTGVELARKDLAIQNKPISKADKDLVRFAQSIAQERHQAINWLMGWNELYSEVDTST